MLARGTAYRCCVDAEEIEAFREQARAEGRPPLFRSPWRDADPATAPDAPFVVRLKAPREGETVVEDVVQGTVTWKNETLDDLILLRSDGTPTYMLAVVVDDHDMGVTHVIRGDDHLTNAARQTLIYRAMDWEVPVFAHIPLIHGAGRRQALQAPRRARGRGLPRHGLSCRRRCATTWRGSAGATATTSSSPPRRRSSGSTSSHLGKAPARFDFAKLESLSGQHIRAADDARAAGRGRGLSCSAKRAAADRGRSARRCCAAMPGLKERARTIPQILDMAQLHPRRTRPFVPDAAAAKVLASAPRGTAGQIDFAPAKC